MQKTKVAKAVSYSLRRARLIEKAVNGASEEELRVAKPFHDAIKEGGKDARL